MPAGFEWRTSLKTPRVHKSGILHGAWQKPLEGHSDQEWEGLGLIVAIFSQEPCYKLGLFLVIICW